MIRGTWLMVNGKKVAAVIGKDGKPKPISAPKKETKPKPYAAGKE